MSNPWLAAVKRELKKKSIKNSAKPLQAAIKAAKKHYKK